MINNWKFVIICKWHKNINKQKAIGHIHRSVLQNSTLFLFTIHVYMSVKARKLNFTYIRINKYQISRNNINFNLIPFFNMQEI